MPNRLRRRGPMRPRWPRTVSPLAVSVLNLVPAIEQARRHHVEGLEVLVYQPKHLLEIRQNAAGELINQERPIRMEHGVGLPKNGFPERRGHGSVRNPRQHVVSMGKAQPGQRRVGVRCGAVDDVEPVVLEAPTKKSHEVGVGLQYHEHRVRLHAAEDFGRESPDTRPVFEKDSGAAPVDFGQDMVDQETRARNEAPEHARVLDEITTE
jgi:hypothetical protein